MTNKSVFLPFKKAFVRWYHMLLDLLPGTVPTYLKYIFHFVTLKSDQDIKLKSFNRIRIETEADPQHC